MPSHIRTFEVLLEPHDMVCTYLITSSFKFS